MNWLDRRLYHRRWWRKLRGLPEPKQYTMAEVQHHLNESMRVFIKQLGDNVNRDYDEGNENRYR